VRRGGDLQLTRNGESEATAIGFDTYTRTRIVVGTETGGLVVSTDGGASWSRLAGTERITEATSFFFDQPDSALVSTYGRALWRFYWPTTRRPSIIDAASFVPLTNLDVRERFGSQPIDWRQFNDPEFCPICVFAYVNQGAIREIANAKDGTVDSITIDGGTVAFADAQGKQMDPPFKVNVDPKAQGLFDQCAACVASTKENTAIRGLVIQDKKMTAILDDIAAPAKSRQGPVPELPAPSAPYLTSSGMPVVGVGMSIDLIASNFSARISADRRDSWWTMTKCWSTRWMRKETQWCDGRRTAHWACTP
jgi:hypothetical protein